MGAVTDVSVIFRNHVEANNETSGVDLENIRQTLDSLKLYFPSEGMGQKVSEP